MLWFVIAGCLAMGGLGYYVARQKGRAGGEGFFFGFLLGPLGVIVEGVLPTVGSPPTRPRSLAERAWTPRGADRSRTIPSEAPTASGGEGAAVVPARTRTRARSRYVAARANSVSPVIVWLGVFTFFMLLVMVYVVTR